jgi:hypothetical protein
MKHAATKQAPTKSVVVNKAAPVQSREKSSCIQCPLCYHIAHELAPASRGPRP